MAELSPAKFKVGDHITVHTDTTQGDDAYRKAGWTGIVTEINERYYSAKPAYGRHYKVDLTSPDGENTREDWNIGEYNLKLTTPERETSTMDYASSLVKEIKALDLTDDQLLLQKHGLVTDDGTTPTSKGIEMAQYKLFSDKTASILADLKKVEAARKAAAK